jgi:transposase InsO family protein
MGLARSTFYDTPFVPLDGDELLARIGAICDEFECYGYRRVGAALRHQGVVVNGKKLRRLMREHGLQPKPRRRYVVTTDSNHAGPIYPDLAKNLVSDGPNQLWVADLTYVAIPGGFVYLAAILDAWSRKVVGYAISRSMDARIAVAALKAAIRNRTPPLRCGTPLRACRKSRTLSLQSCSRRSAWNSSVERMARSPLLLIVSSCGASSSLRAAPGDRQAQGSFLCRFPSSAARRL